MAALTVCDELVDWGNRIRTMEQELTELRDFRNAAVERARMTQTAVVNALNSAAERIEKSTQVLNRTVGNRDRDRVGPLPRKACASVLRPSRRPLPAVASG